MGLADQAVTLAAVLVGATATYANTALLERGKHRKLMATRWDEKKLAAYVDFVSKSRGHVYAAQLLYEDVEGLRPAGAARAELEAELARAEGLRGSAFESVVMLGGAAVISSAHTLNGVDARIDWLARGVAERSEEEWRRLFEEFYGALNTFQAAARRDLGVAGRLELSGLPADTLTAPPARGRRQEES